MADYHGGKRKRQDDGADAPPHKHQRTETVPDYSAHTYAEADPNAYYDYSVSSINLRIFLRSKTIKFLIQSPKNNNNNIYILYYIRINYRH
jgi:hypothetical protein